MSDVLPALPSPIIVTAVLSSADQSYFDKLRRAHYPPARNQLVAHLTMFHHLMPALLPELRQRLINLTRGVPKPRARVTGVMSLGRGTAFSIESDDLAAIRAALADAFSPLLMPQDRAPWRPHITVQNKVTPAQAASLRAALQADFVPRPVGVVGLASWWYRGGPWEAIARYSFR